MTVRRVPLTQQYLREAITYDPDTGVFTWNVRPEHHFGRINQMKNWNGRYPNTIAGKIDNNGYLNIKVNHILYRAHRLAWFYVHGCWPKVLDHEDGNILNNRIRNLRDTTQSENNKNASKRKDNKTGITGVHWRNDNNCWCPCITVNKKTIKLGNTRDFFEACCRRKSAERFYGFHINHGRDKK